MKRLLSNKSGFSLAEIIVAIAVFAVMMAMIMQMLKLSIDQRNENYKFAQDLQEQQKKLVTNGKDTGPLPDGTVFDGKVKLSFKTDPTNSSETPIDVEMDYVVKPADKDTTGDVNEGLNYFVGNYNYAADGVIGGGSGTDGNGLGQSSRYDTRLTGTKGMKNIKIAVSKNPTLPSGVTLGAGQTAYEITVSADCSGMIADDKPDAQIRMYFHSTTDWKSVKVEEKKKVIGADGVEKEEVTGTYYKKVYDEAKIAKVIQTSPSDASPSATASKISGNTVKVGVTNGYGADGLKDSVTFIVIFNGDPKISATSFGNGASGTYNKSNVYEIEKNKDTGEYKNVNKAGKYHENIYGSYPFTISKDPIT